MKTTTATAAPTELPDWYAGEPNADRALELHRRAQRSSDLVLEELGDALEELALLAAAGASDDDEGGYDVALEDLEGDSPEADCRRIHAADCLTILAKIARARALARSARSGEVEAHVALQAGARAEDPVPQ